MKKLLSIISALSFSSTAALGCSTLVSCSNSKSIVNSPNFDDVKLVSGDTVNLIVTGSSAMLFQAYYPAGREPYQQIALLEANINITNEGINAVSYKQTGDTPIENDKKDVADFINEKIKNIKAGSSLKDLKNAVKDIMSSVGAKESDVLISLDFLVRLCKNNSVNVNLGKIKLNKEVYNKINLLKANSYDDNYWITEKGVDISKYIINIRNIIIVKLLDESNIDGNVATIINNGMCINKLSKDENGNFQMRLFLSNDAKYQLNTLSNQDLTVNFTIESNK